MLGRHKNVTMQSEDGSSSYLECRRCGKVKDIPGGVGTLPWGLSG